jgi:hypothetical protein
MFVNMFLNCLCVVMQGVRVSRDTQGNIYATKLAKCDVIVRENQKSRNTCVPDEVFASSGRLTAGEKTKVFVCSWFLIS